MSEQYVSPYEQQNLKWARRLVGALLRNLYPDTDYRIGMVCVIHAHLRNLSARSQYDFLRDVAMDAVHILAAKAVT